MKMFLVMGTKVFFFKNEKYIRYDRGYNKTDTGFPWPIVGDAVMGGGWGGFKAKGFTDNIDAAVNWGNGKAYFFRGKQYLQYNIIDNNVDGPFPIVPNWPGFDKVGFTTIDAAVNWGNGKAYFFKDTNYLKYDIRKNIFEGPFPIVPNWPGFDKVGFTTIDAAVNWGNGKAYFFSKDRYLQYDISKDIVDGISEPESFVIGEKWPGFKNAKVMDGSSFESSVKAALDLFIEDYSVRKLWIPGWSHLRETEFVFKGIRGERTIKSKIVPGNIGLDFLPVPLARSSTYHRQKWRRRAYPRRGAQSI